MTRKMSLHPCGQGFHARRCPLGDLKSLAGTRALGGDPQKDLLKPDPDLPITSGDEVLLCSIGGLSPALRQLMAREVEGLLPFSEIVAVILDEEQVETVGDEGLYLSAHLGKVKVDVHCPSEELPARMKDLAQIWGVPMDHTIMTSIQTKDLTYLRHRRTGKDTVVCWRRAK